MKRMALRLWLWMVALVAVILILLWLFQIVFLNSFYTRMRMDEIKNSSLDILKEIGNRKEFEDRLEKLAYDNNLTAELLDLSHNIVYSVGTSGMNAQMPMMRNALKVEASERVLRGEDVSVPMEHPRFGSKFMLVGLPAIISGKVQGALIITLPLAPVEDTANILKTQLVYITFILLAVTLLLSFLISKSFTKPILGITSVAMDMAAGNLSARSSIGRKDEIGRLAETINYMGKQLSKIDRLRKDLVANVSHELRTPLSLIKGYAETIRDVSGNNPEKREKQLGIIIEEADRLGSIVEDILNLSQMQSGYAKIVAERFKLNETLNRVLKRYEILRERTGIGIVSEDVGEIVVAGDKGKIEQVFYNLINNAFNHSPAGSTIDIKVVETGDNIRVAITDQGGGISQEEIPYIWNRFYKVDKSGKRGNAGTGLGLAIVKSILDAHEVEYGVESQLGIGTTFWFELEKVKL